PSLPSSSDSYPVSSEGHAVTSRSEQERTRRSISAQHNAIAPPTTSRSAARRLRCVVLGCADLGALAGLRTRARIRPPSRSLLPRGALRGPLDGSACGAGTGWGARDRRRRRRTEARRGESWPAG